MWEMARVPYPYPTKLVVAAVLLSMLECSVGILVSVLGLEKILFESGEQNVKPQAKI